MNRNGRRFPLEWFKKAIIILYAFYLCILHTDFNVAAAEAVCNIESMHVESKAWRLNEEIIKGIFNFTPFSARSFSFRFPILLRIAVHARNRS